MTLGESITAAARAGRTMSRARRKWSGSEPKGFRAQLSDDEIAAFLKRNRRKRVTTYPPMIAMGGEPSKPQPRGRSVGRSVGCGRGGNLT